MAKESKAEVVEATPTAKRTETALARTMTPGQLATALLNRGDFTVDDLAKLSDLELKREANEERKAFAHALVLFQDKVSPIIKTGHRDDRKIKSKRTGDFGTVKYDYAELSTTIDQIRPLLKECGLVPTWQSTAKSGPAYIEIECKLTHIMGHSETSMPLGSPPLEGGGLNAVQQRIGTVTMLKRATLFMALGLVTKDDDKDMARGEQGEDAPEAKSKTVITDPERKSKEAFVIACRQKTGNPKLPNEVAKAIFEYVRSACKSDKAADCLGYIQRADVVIDKKGTVSVIGEAPEGLSQDELAALDVGASEFKYECDECGQRFKVKPANGQCPGAEGKRCFGQVVEITT